MMAEDTKCQCKKLQKQLKRYETRFSDLVSSYKTIIEEKKVLEETLKTLSTPSSPSLSSLKASAKSSTEDGLSAKQTFGDPLGACGSDSSIASEDASQNEHVSHLEDKIAALSKALNSMSEGKTKIEEAFKNDRKSLIVEHTIKLQKAEEEKEAAEKRESKTRAKLREEQDERENEAKAHSLMLKELQEILALERNENGALKRMLQERVLIEEQQRETVVEDTHQPQVNVISGSDNNTDVYEEDETVEADQMYSTENHNNYDAIENSLSHQRAQEERRIAELESKITELSDVVGTYDRKRQDDQSLIRKLRERLEGLELENTSLLQTSSCQSPGGNCRMTIYQFLITESKFPNFRLPKVTDKTERSSLSLIMNS